MASKCMLTTFDNPYNPFDEFTSWFMFDEEKGYHSCAYLMSTEQKKGHVISRNSAVSAV